MLGIPRLGRNQEKRTVVRSDAQSMRHLEEELRKLERANIDGTGSYRGSSPQRCSFSGWVEEASELRDPDRVRNAFYYGFQPLFDVLVDHRTELDGARDKAVRALSRLTAIGIKYLAGYYQGEPDTRMFRKSVGALRPLLDDVDGYRRKERNIDWNHIYPPAIHAFLTKVLTAVVDENVLFPEYILGCACGASEIAMPLAGMMRTELGFIRFSKRREDGSPRIIQEQEAAIRAGTEGRAVLCIEDYVCSGRSLGGVMKRAAEYGADEVWGASIRDSNESRKYLQREAGQKGFHLFRPR